MPKYDLHEEVKRLRAETADWNKSMDDKENLGTDMTLLDAYSNGNITQNMTTEGGLLTSNRRVRRPVKGDKVDKLDRTCIDTDDDDFEFEDAVKEEEEDIKLNDVSAYMVSKNNVSKYQFDQSQLDSQNKQGNGNIL